MRRRDMLKLAGAAALSAGAGAAAQDAEPAPPAKAPSPPLVPVDVSAGRVIRTVAGLRPYRPTGFVVRAEKLFWRQTLIHNYGHGGSGVTLSWGSAALAVQTALAATDERRYAVLGCGVMGLTTSLLLARRGFEVTIYAEHLPPDTTSNVAAAVWGPSRLFARRRVDDAFLDRFVRVARASHRAFQHYANDPSYGVRWIREYNLEAVAPDDPDAIAAPLIGDDLYPGLAADPEAAARFGAAYALSFHALMIDPDIYLRALWADFERAGGRIVQRRFETLYDVTRLEERAIVNCTGLGTKALFGDDELTPVRGQLTMLLPQPEIDYGYVTWTDDGLLYMYPRQSAIVLGGTMQDDNWSQAVDDIERTRVLLGHAEIARKLAGRPDASSP